MSDSEDRIRDMVRSALEADPKVKNKDLLARAKEIDARTVEGLTLRQFHGKFRLPVSRTLTDAAAPAKPAKRRGARSAQSDPGVGDGTKRDAVREIFRRFAVQLSRAEGRSEIVRAAARIDEFVDEVVRTFAGPDGAGTSPRKTRRRRMTASAEDRRSSSESPVPSESTASATTLVGEPPPRDMRRRRRPKATLQTASAPVSRSSTEESVSATTPAPEVGPPASQPRQTPERSATSTLSHDLEEFRRRRYERERGGRKLP